MSGIVIGVDDLRSVLIGTEEYGLKVGIDCASEVVSVQTWCDENNQFTTNMGAEDAERLAMVLLAKVAILRALKP